MHRVSGTDSLWRSCSLGSVPELGLASASASASGFEAAPAARQECSGPEAEPWVAAPLSLRWLVAVASVVE